MAEPRSLYEQIESAVSDLGALIEALGGEVYQAVEAEGLKRLAIEAGVDHTREPTFILREIGGRLQHERNVNRELRRQIAALTRLIEGRRPMTDEQTDRDERKAEVLASLSLQNRIDAAVAAEREACAGAVDEMCDDVDDPFMYGTLRAVAAAIRNRGEAS